MESWKPQIMIDKFGRRYCNHCKHWLTTGLTGDNCCPHCGCYLGSIREEN